MTTPNLAPTTTRQAAVDPTVAGYRQLFVEDASGYRHTVWQPLTREELLHPGENDYEMASQLHLRLIQYLYHVFTVLVEGVAGGLVLSDVPIDWGEPSGITHRPDITVVFGARELGDRDAFEVRVEGVRPILIAEVTSRTTRLNDVQDKMGEYAERGVEWYLIVDRIERDAAGRIQVLLHRLVDGAYRQVEPSTDGSVSIEPFQAVFVGRVETVDCYDRFDQLIAEPMAERAARQAAQLDAAQARAQADQALARAEAEADARRAIAAELAELRQRLSEIEAKRAPSDSGSSTA